MLENVNVYFHFVKDKKLNSRGYIHEKEHYCFHYGVGSG